ncbi:MAG: flippase [Planctomycetes bacterium]|nr:flippase [Planctomycetota bacterium]
MTKQVTEKGHIKLKSAIFGFVFLFFGKIGNSLIGMLNVMLLARCLGRSGFGMFSYANTFASYFGALTSLGTREIAIREGACDHQAIPVISGNILIINIVLGLATFLTTCIAIRSYSDNDLLIYLVTILALGHIVRAVRNLDFVFFSLSRFSLFFFVQLSTALISLVLVALGAYWEMNVTYFIYITVVTTAISSLICLFIYRTVTHLVFKIDIPLIKKLFCQGIPLGMAQFLISTHTKVDIFFIERFLDLESVGLYTAAVMIMEKTCLIFIVFHSSFFPKLSQTYEQDKDRFVCYISGGLLFLILFALCVILVILLVPELFVYTIFGQDFLPSIPVLTILIFALIPRAISSLMHQVHVITGLTRSMLPFEGLALLLNVILNYYMIPEMGMRGAALSTIIASITLVTLRQIYFYHKLRLLFFSPKIFSPNNIQLFISAMKRK